MTYYIFIQNDVINGSGQCRQLTEGVTNLEVEEVLYNAYVENPDMYIWSGTEVIVDPEYEAKQAQKEKERINELSMTRSDFFDGTIKAFRADADDLLAAIQAVLATLPMDEVEKKVAINNYKNALNFYRKHPLFTMLSGVEIPIAEGAVIITITAEQWDMFFDETDKDNPYAYTYLQPLIPQEPPVEGKTNETESDTTNEPTDVSV